MNLEKELNKYSKEAIIKAICKFAFNRKRTILEDVTNEEIEICFAKKQRILDELNNLKIENIKGTYENQLKMISERKKIYDDWKRLDKKLNKLLKL